MLRWLFAAKNPCALSALPNPAAATCLARVSNAMAGISARTLRSVPASVVEDSCRMRNSTAGSPAGVYRNAPSSTSVPLKAT